jgi:hypothetical protein
MAWTLAELRSLVDDYERALIAASLASTTVRTATDQATRFLRWMDGEYSPRGSSPAARRHPVGARLTIDDLRADVSAYQQALLEAGLSPVAVYAYVDPSGRFISWLEGTYVPGAAPGTRHAAGGHAAVGRATQPSQRRTVPTPTVGQLAEARARYRAIEPRDLFYRAATELLGRARDRVGSLLTVGEALAVLLFTWNSAYYRYHPAAPDHVDRIERLLETYRSLIDRWRTVELGPLAAAREGPHLQGVFEAFEELLGPVGAGKALHLLAPSFCPIWDRTIAARYGCSVGRAGTNGARYVRFMSMTADQCSALRGLADVPSDLVKALDEWNYVTFTRP